MTIEGDVVPHGSVCQNKNHLLNPTRQLNCEVNSIHVTRLCFPVFPLQLMAAMGNNAAKAKYEQKVPAFYYRPTHSDCK